MHQSTTPSLSQTIWLRWASRQFLSLPIVQTLLPETFRYSLSSETVMKQFRRWKKLCRRSLTRSHKRTSLGPSRSCWNSTSAAQPEEITSKFHVCTINKSAHTKKGLETYLIILVTASFSGSCRGNFKWIFFLRLISGETDTTFPCCALDAFSLTCCHKSQTSQLVFPRNHNFTCLWTDG